MISKFRIVSSSIALQRYDCLFNGKNTCIWVNWMSGKITIHTDRGNGREKIEKHLDEYNEFEGDLLLYLDSVLRLTPSTC